jgi:hypothetical protein
MASRPDLEALIDAAVIHWPAESEPPENVDELWVDLGGEG